MKHDNKLKPGFYWVRFEGEVIVAERVKRHATKPTQLHWHVSGSEICFDDKEVCELLGGPLKFTPTIHSESPVFIQER
jgi:hypothetical protein